MTATATPSLPRVDYQYPDTNNSGGDRDGRPLLALVGEAPGREEVKAGRPFVGRSGQLLDRHLTAAGITRSHCLIANVFRYQPPDNLVAHFFASRARARREGLALAEALGPFGGSAYCLAAFAGELESLRQALTTLRPAAIVALGRTPLWALTGLSGILQCRGQIQPGRLVPGIPVVPTYHPSYLLRGQFQAEPLFQADLRLAASLAAGITP